MGFEPTTNGLKARCATCLRHTPVLCLIIVNTKNRVINAHVNFLLTEKPLHGIMVGKMIVEVRLKEFVEFGQITFPFLEILSRFRLVNQPHSITHDRHSDIRFKPVFNLHQQMSQVRNRRSPCLFKDGSCHILPFFTRVFNFFGKIKRYLKRIPMSKKSTKKDKVPRYHVLANP